MLKILLVSAAVTGLVAPAFAQTTQTQTTPPAAKAAPATTMPATPAVTSASPGAIKGSTLINMDVKNTANEKIGDINDVIVGADGKVEQVIVSVGGFLGVGSRKVAIAWNEVKVDPTEDVAFVNMSKQQLQQVPEFKDTRTKP